MPARLIFAAEARLQLKDIFERCLRVYPTNLRHLRATFRVLFAELAESPLRWAVWRPPHHRSRLVPRYPYRIIYRIAADQSVIVVAILHQRQDPTRRLPP